MIGRRRVLTDALAYAGAATVGGGLGALTYLDPAEPVAVFDEVWRRVGADYYDPPEREVWARVRRTFLPKAREARSTAELYLAALTPMLETLDRSHLGVQPPPGTRLPLNAAVRLPRQRRGDVSPMFHP